MIYPLLDKPSSLLNNILGYAWKPCRNSRQNSKWGLPPCKECSKSYHLVLTIVDPHTWLGDVVLSRYSYHLVPDLSAAEFAEGNRGVDQVSIQVLPVSRTPTHTLSCLSVDRVIGRVVLYTIETNGLTR